MTKEDNFGADKIIFLDGPNGVTEKIKKAMYDAARTFVYIGLLLYEVQTYRYYEEKGYQNVYEYAEVELGFKRSSTKNLIAINTTFGTDRNGLHTMYLLPEYKDFKYSQLCEMLSMSAAKREAVTPDMTVKEIRSLKKQPESPPDSSKEKINGQTSGQIKQETETVAITINNIWKDAPKELIQALVKLANLRCTPKMCFDITIVKHTDY